MGSSSSKPREVTSAENRRSVSRNVFQDNCIINKSSFSSNDIDDNDVTHDDDEQYHNHAMSYYICEDLIDEIFIRLPFKSLVRNTSLSKSWCARISTPSFARKHALRSVTTPLTLHKYFLREHIWYDSNQKDFSTNCILLEKGYANLTEVKRYTNLTSVQVIVSNRFKIVGACNGIICLLNEGVQSITLWNPSIRRKLTVPTYPSSNKWVSFGFGFDPISDDYKIVAMCHSYKDAQISFIYSLKTNSWSKIVSATPKFYYVCSDLSACFFKGTLHWVVQSNQHCIITFDLSTNVFGFISLPKPDSGYFAPMIIKGCLAVIFVSRGGGEHCSIWVMREYNNVASWTKAFDKDSISYNHETRTRSRLIVDSYYTVDMDMCIESLELLDKEIVRDESDFLAWRYKMY